MPRPDYDALREKAALAFAVLAVSIDDPELTRVSREMVEYGDPMDMEVLIAVANQVMTAPQVAEEGSEAARKAAVWLAAREFSAELGRIVCQHRGDHE